MSFTIQLSYAGTPAGTITYDAATDRINVIGANSTHPAEFEDLYLADVAGGWGQVTKLSTTSYQFDAIIMIGNNSNATYFADNRKQAVSTKDFFIYVNKATLTFGSVMDAALKTSRYGCSLTMNSSTYGKGMIWAGNGSTVNLYSSYFQAVNARFCIIGSSSDTLTLWNSELDNRAYVSGWSTTSAIYNTITNNADVGIELFLGSVTRYSIFESDYADIYNDAWNTVYNITGLYSRGHNYLVRSYQVGFDYSLIDADVDSWVFGWASTCTGEIYRKNSFNLYVLNGALTDFVEDANVTLTHDGTVFGSWLTNSTGQIATQTLTYGFYNQTGGNTMYGGTPWTLTITHPDWETYTSVFYPYSKIDWSISMQDTSTSNNNMLLVGLLVGSLAFLGLVVIRRKL